MSFILSVPLALLLAPMSTSAGASAGQVVSTAQEAQDDQPAISGYPGEEPVDPYTIDNRNAGATPFPDTRLADSFGGQPGIKTMAESFVDRITTDPRIAEIFIAHDEVRLRRTLYEQFCYILNAGCDYSGRDMRSAHQDLGLQVDDLNALVEILQGVMRDQNVPFAAQNRLLAKLAPMKRDVVSR